MSLEKSQSFVHAPPPSPKNYQRVNQAFDAITFFMGGFNYSGGEHLPRTPDSYVLAANHDNMFEVMLAPKGVTEETGEAPHIPAKKKFWEYPLIGSALGGYFASLGAFPVDRGKDISAQNEVLSEMERLIAARAILLWFPQMTRKNHEKGQVPLRSLKASSMIVIAKHNLEIVPTGTDGKIFPYVHFAEPFKINAPEFDIADLTQLVELHSTVLKPMLRNELQPRMQDAANEARRRRREIVADSIPKRMLWRLYHPLGGGDLHLDFGVAAGGERKIHQ